MRSVLLAALLLTACGDVDPDDDTGSESSGSTSDATAGPACGDGHVDPGEDCDGGEHCDAWCMPAAYIIPRAVHAFDLSTITAADLQCASEVKFTGTPQRQYLPYIGSDPLAAMSPLVPPQHYSVLCDFGTATESPAATLADIGQLSEAQLCGVDADLQFHDIWVDTCESGTGKVRAPGGGLKDINCADADYQALLLCVGQPL